MDEQFTGAEVDVLIALRRRGPLTDGDIPSKSGRDALCLRDLVTYDNGTNRLTERGAAYADQLIAEYGKDGP